MKRLYKSRTNKVISGVCGGVAEYFNWDPSIVRLIWAAAIVFTAGTLALVLYIICACVLPVGPVDDGGYHHQDFPPPHN